MTRDCTVDGSLNCVNFTSIKHHLINNVHTIVGLLVMRLAIVLEILSHRRSSSTALRQNLQYNLHSTCGCDYKSR
jgi:hypothetical protein